MTDSQINKMIADHMTDWACKQLNRTVDSCMQDDNLWAQVVEIANNELKKYTDVRIC